MSPKPFFSIVIPTYNRSKDLQCAIRQDLNQTFQDFEIIVSDNNSTDNTAEVVKNFQNKKIRYFKNKKNIGVLKNLRQAVTYARGMYIFLQSDDDFLLYEDVLAKVHAILKAHPYGFVRVNYATVYVDKKTIFDFRVNKSMKNDEILPPHKNALEVIDFIEKVDSRFITGIIYKNSLDQKIKIIESHIISWFNPIYHNAKKYGAYYIHRPYIIGSWSVWRTKKDNSDHPLYGLKNGKLQAEPYYEAVRNLLAPNKYSQFIHAQLMDTFVKFLPLVKLTTGNKNLIKISKRIFYLDSRMKYTLRFYFYFIFSYILPTYIVSILRKVILKRLIQKNIISDKKMHIALKRLGLN